MKRIYLDYAAATPVNPKVMKVMEPYFTDIFYNPSALYQGSRQAKAGLEAAREQTAQIIGCRPSEVIFTAGGSESTNLAIQGIMTKFPEGNMVLSAVEHEAVREPSLAFQHETAPVDSKGRVQIDELKMLIQPHTVLVSVMMVNNEVGTIQAIKEIAVLIKNLQKIRKLENNDTPLYFHTDACQAPNYLDVNVARLGVDMMTLNGGKIYGPKQSGILYLKAGVVLNSLIKGGGQEMGYRSGTENIAFAVGFAKALGLAQKSRVVNTKKVSDLRDYFSQQLQERFDTKISGHAIHKIANNVHAVFDEVDNERVIFALDDSGVDVAAGSACSASNDEASHVLTAMGYSEQESRSSVRFTLGNQTTKSEIDLVLDKLVAALRA